ncbi:MAG: phytoene desaturase [Candidatus Omnitrophica bacterium]|nr:phytoene desaturase [Candidatus Omnitrophota bacterium]
MKKKVAVIGAGVGGLSTAARLARSGFQVEVFEKLAKCGGRNHLLESGGFKFDMGPSFVLMPDFFEEVFSYCNEDIGDYLDFRKLDVNYKIFFPDGKALTIYSDNLKTKEELERIEKGSPASYDRFIKKTEEFYALVRPLLFKCFSWKQLFNPGYWPLLTKLKPFDSYWGIASKFFKTEKLRYAFTFEAMFMGVSPYQAPGFYSIITYADQVQKIYHPMGGMYQIPLALEKMAKKFGAEFYYNTEVSKVYKTEDGIWLESEKGTTLYDYAVVNADYCYAQESILGRRLPDYRYSCSVFLIYLGLKQKIPGLEHHNLFFSGDLNKNLNQIFKDSEFPDDPSFYIHVPTVTDPKLAPEGKEIVYILIPVANLKNCPDTTKNHQERLRKNVFRKIKEITGEDLEPLIEVEHRFYPEDFIKSYNIKNGATFGLAHNLMQSAFFRPANFDNKIKGLFFAGASTQPGGGLPVVIASSRIVADLIRGN